MQPAEVAALIRSDAYLSFHYRSCYQALESVTASAITAPAVELGAGSGISADVWPDLVRSDLDASPTNGLATDALSLPFRDESIGALVLKDALHHIPDPERFFSEARRVLQPGGVVSVLDPYWGPLARIIYRWLHPEPFDDRAASWAFDSSSPNDSNQAILWLVLRRDRARFERLFPEFEVVEHGAVIGPSFLLSGGLHGRSPIPSSLLVRLGRFEVRQGRWLDPFRFGYLVTFRKRVT